MKKLLHLIPALLLAGILFNACQETINEPIPISENTRLFAVGGNPDVYPLYAGQSIPVGEVQVWNDEVNLYIKYIVNLTDWCLQETHVAVATSLEGIPQKNGNPIPGQFPYSGEHDCVTEVLYTIPLPEGIGCEDEIVVATHAAVINLNEVCDYEKDLVESLPDQVQMKVQYPYPGGPAYFPVTTVAGGTSLDGTYHGWCVDTDNTIANNTWYTANVYSSYETLPEGIVEYPDNLDLVNWIVNQDFVGQPSPGCSGNYTYGDVQRAIWTLVEDNPSESGLGAWSQCRVDEILAAASANGEGFEPDCGDVVAVIFAPVNGQQVIIAQVIVGEVPVPCTPIYCDETAWGGVEPFAGNNWATYINYVVTCTGPLTGEWVLTANGQYIHDIVLDEDYNGSITGTGQYRNATNNETWIGQRTDNSITLTVTYAGPYNPGYTATISGTIDATFNSMSGGAGTGGVTSWTATRVVP
jgi:hypothetical protein